MPNVIDEVIAALRDSGDVTRACQTAESWAEEGRIDDLSALATALEAHPAGENAAAFEALLEHVEDQIALTPGEASVAAAIALAIKARGGSDGASRDRAARVRAFASRLGYGQEPGVLLATLEREGGRDDARELLACWMHEVVLRGTSLASDPRARSFHERLVAVNHPLGGLPLALFSVEREAPSYMPLYGDRGLNRAIATLESGPMSARTVPPPADASAARIARVESEEVTARLASAVRPWAEGVKARVEAHVFSIAPAIDVGAMGSWVLRALPLESTRSAVDLDVRRTGADFVFGALFSAASNGGAYSAGLGGAYGRLAAWASFGALVGAPPEATLEAIDDTAARCGFLSYRARGPWFHDVAWDLGTLALRPDGQTVAVLAATDRD